MVPIRIQHLITGAMLLAAACGVGLILAGTRDSPFNPDARIYPDSLDTRIELSANEEVRTVELYPDRITAKHSVADHADGSITNLWYRPDGTIEKAVTQSKPDAQGMRVQLRYAEVAADGRTYVLDIENFPDGRKAKETRLNDDGSLRRVYFYENGNERRSQLIRPERSGWKLASEDLFREDRSLAESLRNLDNKAWERKLFNEQGVLTTFKSMGAYETSYTEIGYQPDGVTRARLLEQNASMTRVTTYRANGARLTEHTWNGPLTGTSMLVVSYDDRDRQVYQQWWSYTEGKLFLWLVKEYRPDRGALARVIYLERDSSKATEIVYHGDGEYSPNYMRRTYRSDGTLSLEEDVVMNKTVATREFTVEEKIRLKIAAERLQASQPDPMPSQVIPYSPPPMGGP